jgi:hypothetical protein
LIEEYQAGMQAISSAVFAVDALYGVIAGMITVPEAEIARRKQRNDGRAVWVADAIIRASARMPNDVRKAVPPPAVDASGHSRTVCPSPGVLRRWQSASVLGFGTKRPMPT